MARIRRQVVESADFAIARQSVPLDARRWENVLSSISWAVGSDPEQAGEETDTEGVWALTTDTYPGAPGLIVYYKWDEARVTLLGLVVIEEEELG